MKYLLITVMLMLAGCVDHVSEVNQWIHDNKKPILTFNDGQNILNERVYTLISANGDVFTTARVRMTLPDTIKMIKVPKDWIVLDDPWGTSDYEPNLEKWGTDNWDIDTSAMATKTDVSVQSDTTSYKMYTTSSKGTLTSTTWWPPRKNKKVPHKAWRKDGSEHGTFTEHTRSWEDSLSRKVDFILDSLKHTSERLNNCCFFKSNEVNKK